MKRRGLVAVAIAAVIVVALVAPIGEWVIALVNWIDANRAIAAPNGAPPALRMRVRARFAR